MSLYTWVSKGGFSPDLQPSLVRKIPNLSSLQELLSLSIPEAKEISAPQMEHK